MYAIQHVKSKPQNIKIHVHEYCKPTYFATHITNTCINRPKYVKLGSFLIKQHQLNWKITKLNSREGD